MEFKSNDDEVNMDDHVFDEDYEDNDNENDDSEVGIDAQLCLSNIFNLGWTKIDKSKVKEVRELSRDR